MKRLVISASVALLLGIWCGIELGTWLDMDRCLDNGNRWNDEFRYCEVATAFPAP